MCIIMSLNLSDMYSKFRMIHTFITLYRNYGSYSNCKKFSIFKYLNVIRVDIILDIRLVDPILTDVSWERIISIFRVGSQPGIKPA
jgi:hypothetical protein